MTCVGMLTPRCCGHRVSRTGVPGGASEQRFRQLCSLCLVVRISGIEANRYTREEASQKLLSLIGSPSSRLPRNP